MVSGGLVVGRLQLMGSMSPLSYQAGRYFATSVLCAGTKYTSTYLWHLILYKFDVALSQTY